jgi:hypothetical protein
MSNREVNKARTMLANAFATAGAELLDYMGTAAALAAIPNTDPPRYVVAGTLAMIAKVLPSAEAPAAATVLTDERIINIATKAFAAGEMSWAGFTLDSDGRYMVPVISPMEFGLVRAVLKALGAHAGVTAEPAAWESSLHKSDDAKRVMMAAHSHCPSELTHPQKMAWMADFFIKHYAAPTIPAQVPAAEVRAQALEEAAKICDAKYQARVESGHIREASAARSLAIEIRSLAQQSTADKASEVRAADPKQLAKWWSLRGSVITAAINQEPARFPVGDLSELLNVFDAAMPDDLSTADSANTGALGEKGAK